MDVGVGGISLIPGAGNVASVTTVGMEFAQEFALESVAEHAQELILEAGLGALATLIPFAEPQLPGVVFARLLDSWICRLQSLCPTN